MQNTFVEVKDGMVIFDQMQLTTCAIVAAAAVLFVVILTLSLKARKKGFIKTVPTNVKRG